MIYYYSPSAKGFFVDSVHTVIPDDKIELTKDQYDILMDNHVSGRTIDVVDGKLTTVALVVLISWDEIRNKRNILLTRCDWTQMPDADLTDEERAEWVVYRQALRDITESYNDPNEVVWPVAPGSE